MSSYLSPRSCGQLLSMHSVLHDRVALGVQRDGLDRIPVPSAARPALRVAAAGLQVEFVARCEDRAVFAAVPGLGAHVLDAAVQVFDVVPA